MTGKYWGHRFKKYQHNKRHFNEPMQATVYIFRQRTCCFLQINQFYVRWFGSFGWWMFYTVNILDTIRHLPCLCWMFRHLGCSAPLPKTADPQLDTDSELSKNNSRKIANIFLSISLNMCFGCSTEPSLFLLSTNNIIMFWLRNKKIIFSYTLSSGGLF